MQYLAPVGNDSCSTLHRPSYSLLIKATLANPLFHWSCPRGVLGNLSVTATWRSTHLCSIVFKVSSHPDLLGKHVRCPLAFLVVGQQGFPEFLTHTYADPKNPGNYMSFSTRQPRRTMGCSGKIIISRLRAVIKRLFKDGTIFSTGSERVKEVARVHFVEAKKVSSFVKYLKSWKPCLPSEKPKEAYSRMYGDYD